MAAAVTVQRTTFVDRCFMALLLPLQLDDGEVELIGGGRRRGVELHRGAGRHARRVGGLHPEGVAGWRKELVDLGLPRSDRARHGAIEVVAYAVDERAGGLSH